MTYKQLKEHIEKNIKLLRPDQNPDEMEIAYIDIHSYPDLEEIKIGFTSKNMLCITDSPFGQ